MRRFNQHSIKEEFNFAFPEIYSIQVCSEALFSLSLHSGQQYILHTAAIVNI